MRRKKHRLPLESYRGKKFLAVTMCERDRRPVLCEAGIFAALTDQLNRSCSKNDCKAPVFCVMPDHIHLMLQGCSDVSNVLEAANHFKLISGIWLFSNKPEIRWQKEFYDHLIGSGEVWAKHARYIASNPWRAGLVPEGEGWPYQGSIGYDLSEVLEDAFWGR